MYSSQYCCGRLYKGEICHFLKINPDPDWKVVIYGNALKTGRIEWYASLEQVSTFQNTTNIQERPGDTAADVIKKKQR